MSSEITPTNIKINVMNREQYDSVSVKSPAELYFVEENDRVTLVTNVVESFPSSPKKNDTCILLNDTKIYTYNGSSWDSKTLDKDCFYIDASTNNTYIWDGTILRNVGGGSGGSVRIDNVTIKENADENIEVHAKIEQNKKTAMYDWIGTKAEYQALKSYNNNWVYYITDEESETPNTSFDNIVNRLNRASAWTDTTHYEEGELYNLYIYPSGEAIVGSPINCYEWYSGYGYVIVDGWLYNLNYVNNQVIATKTEYHYDDVTCVSGNYWISSGNLYYYSNGNPRLVDSSGWIDISPIIGTNANKQFGIKNNKLYVLRYGDISSYYKSDGPNFLAINDVIALEEDGTINFLEDGGANDNQFNNLTSVSSIYVGGYIYACLFISDEKLFYAKDCQKTYSEVVLIDDTYEWKKVQSLRYDDVHRIFVGLTVNGNIYEISIDMSGNVNISQIGVETYWGDICSINNKSFYGIRNGNVYRIMYDNEYNISPVMETGQIETFGNSRIAVNTPYIGVYTSQSVTDQRTVYTVKNPVNGFTAYDSLLATSGNTISNIDTINNRITAGEKTYKRDPFKDTIFKGLPEDSKNQMLTVYDLIKAIKG